MNKKIVSTILIAALTISSVFATVTYNGGNAKSDSPMKINLNSTISKIEYSFEFVQKDVKGTDNTAIQEALLTKSPSVEDGIFTKTVDIKEDGTVGAFGIKSSIGNQKENFKVTVKVDPGQFKGQSTVNAEEGPTLSLGDYDTTEGQSFKTYIGSKRFVSRFKTGLNQPRLISAFSLSWVGMPNLRPDTYRSSSTISITID